MIRAVPRLALAVAGAIVYAVSGGLMGAQNAGWLAERDANALLPFLGIGAALAITAMRKTSFHERLASSAIGRIGGCLLVLGAVLYVVSWAIDFAIFGTLTLAFGLICVAVAFWAARIGEVIDRVLAVLAAVFSLTWNTETPSAFLLVGVGVIWAVLSFRMLRSRGFAAAPSARA